MALLKVCMDFVNTRFSGQEVVNLYDTTDTNTCTTIYQPSVIRFYDKVSEERIRVELFLVSPELNMTIYRDPETCNYYYKLYDDVVHQWFENCYSYDDKMHLFCENTASDNIEDCIKFFKHNGEYYCFLYDDLTINPRQRPVFKLTDDGWGNEVFTNVENAFWNIMKNTYDDEDIYEVVGINPDDPLII